VSASLRAVTSAVNRAARLGAVELA
jgi:hypothetical protein